MTRRRAFADGCSRSKGKFYRPLTCGQLWESGPSVAIGPHSLDGKSLYLSLGTPLNGSTAVRFEDETDI